MKGKAQKDSEKRKKIRRSCFLTLTVAFFCFAAGITLCSVKLYSEKLPAVTIAEFAEVELDGKKYDTAVPRQALYPDEGEMTYHLFWVSQKEGPWGEEYYAVQGHVLCPDEWYCNEGEMVPVACLDTVEGPVIVEHQGEIYEGAAVKFSVQDRDESALFGMPGG